MADRLPTYLLVTIAAIFSLTVIRIYNPSVEATTKSCDPTPSQAVIEPSISIIPTEPIASPSAVESLPVKSESGTGGGDGLHQPSSGLSDGLCSAPPCITPGNTPQGAPNTGRIL